MYTKAIALPLCFLLPALEVFNTLGVHKPYASKGWELRVVAAGQNLIVVTFHC